MANPENIKPISSTKVARERGRKGGLAKARNERARRTMQETVRMVLDMPCREGKPEDAAYMSDLYQRDKNGKLKTDKHGNPIPKNLTVEQASIIAIAKKAMNGDVKAMAFLRDSAGEKPVERLEINSDMAKVETEIGEMIAEMDADG